MANQFSSTVAVVFALVLDRLYYQQWTVPSVRFLYFNLAQSLAVFYGSNRWDYYLTEGLPLLLTTVLPFGLWGIYESIRYTEGPYARTRYSLALTTLIAPLILSSISHKEVRFIYPLLPIIHVLAASPFARYLDWAWTATFGSHVNYQQRINRRLSLFYLILFSIVVSYLATTSHQTAPLTVLEYLRHEYVNSRSDLSTPRPYLSGTIGASTRSEDTMTVSFLMPCHSTPWRSHLIFPGIRAWALSCEPPLGIPYEERKDYLDEADEFYQDPVIWMNNNLGRPPRSREDVLTSMLKNGKKPAPWDGGSGKKMWTEYVVFFEQLEETMKEVLGTTGSRDVQGPSKPNGEYDECWRGWNSWGHDDWRRKGDIVVWCLRR